MEEGREREGEEQGDTLAGSRGTREEEKNAVFGSSEEGGEKGSDGGETSFTTEEWRGTIV